MPRLGSEWCDRWKRDDLTLPDAHQALEETWLLAERLEEPTVLRSDHVTNFLDINGRIPDDTDVMLEAIDEALEWPLMRFKPPTERSINVGL